ncbi:MAG TPA: amino acid adenylation domain-containing protein [Candidatus Angelobacter sp.]|nr:amino acid adenylation domain-containing protein [Candidatus Angelobacter sp.]
MLDEVAQLGVTLAAESGQLRISAPKGTLTRELQRRVVESKDEILRRLQTVALSVPVRSSVRLKPDPLGDALSFPLSDLQLGFYIANDSYMEFHVRPHCYLEYDLIDLDPVAYEAAWNKMLHRHRRELCTVTRDIKLKLLSGDPILRCQIYDLHGSNAEEVGGRLLGIRKEMNRQELPLDAWPWLDLRISLWTENGREMARVHYNHNNFFSDGFGTMQFLHEIDEYYSNPGLTYPPLTLSYRDAVLGLERLDKSELGGAAYNYWAARLPGLPPPPSLPQKAGLNRRCRSQLERREGGIEKPLWDAFKSRAAAFGITPSNAMIAAYAYVIVTWSNSDHFILSQMVTRRFADLHPDLTRMLGNFASLYPLEIKLSASASFADNAKRIQEQVMEDMEHLQIGGMRVLQELNRLKGSFGTAPSPFVVGSGLSLKKYKKAAYTLLETSQTVLDHQFFELEDGSCYYVWDLIEVFFPEGVIAHMWDAFNRLVHLLASDSSAWLHTDFDLVHVRDLRDRHERNQTAEPVSTSGLHAALSKEAVVRSNSIVLLSAQGPLSYGALDAESNALAAELWKRGVRRGDLVPVIMDRDKEMLVAVMAILKAGAAYVPIDPRLPQARIALLLTSVGSRLAVTQPKYTGLPAWPEGMTVLCGSLNGPAAGASNGDISCTAGNSDLAYVIYTSGSTGTPKGVMISHCGALNTILDINRRFNVGPSDRLFGVSEFNFDLSVYDIFGTIAAGACLVYPDPESAQDPMHWLELTLRENITIWNSVPALMRLWVEAAERRRARVPSLRLVLLSGDKIPLDLPAAIRLIAPNANIVSLGGATEASIWSILYPIQQVEPTWATIPYGYPMVNQRWYARDRNGKDCPTWVPGELHIGGVGLAQGYWQDSEKTERSFYLDPLTGERLYRTGDLGRYLPGGCLEWMGRLDFQVKVQGQRIELGEIEAVLGEHPSIVQAVVVLEETMGRHEPRLVGYIVPKEDACVEVKHIVSFLQNKLPPHMLPTAWRMLERLPLTANGKIDRKALPKTHFIADADSHKKREYVEPVNAIEQRLQAIWESILGVARIGVTDDFFDLGGQSFDAIRIFALIKEELGRAFTLSDIWQARTIRELGKGITCPEDTPQIHRIVPIDLRGTGDSLFLVHPAGGSVMTYTHLGERINRPLYGIQAFPRLDDTRRRTDVIAMAKEYVTELKQHQPAGAYLLGGWSSGAMIAFEMASQLEASGERVNQVFILDGPAPVPRADVSDKRLLLWFLQDLVLDLPLERLEGETFLGLKPEEQLRKAAALLKGPGMLGLDIESMMESFLVFRDVVIAGTRYNPTRISSNLTVVRVEDDIVDEFSTHPGRDAIDWGWSRFTTGNVRCIRVSGTHHTFLKQPILGDWCELFNGAEPAGVRRA